MLQILSLSIFHKKTFECLSCKLFPNCIQPLNALQELKQPFGDVFKIKCCQVCSFIIKRLQHVCFPVNIAKFLRTDFIQCLSGGCFCRAPTFIYRMKFFQNFCFCKNFLSTQKGVSTILKKASILLSLQNKKRFSPQFFVEYFLKNITARFYFLSPNFCGVRVWCQCYEIYTTQSSSKLKMYIDIADSVDLMVTKEKGVIGEKKNT